MVFFFLSLRESPSQPGTIEPDIPFSSSSPSETTSTKLATTTSSYREYVTRWDMSDKPALARRCVCFLILALHVPINILSLFAHGGLGFIFGVIWSVLNFICIAYAVFKLDTMRGQRLLFGKLYSRHHFDYVLLGLFIFYAVILGKLFLRMRGIVWQILASLFVCADIICFLTGWFATWRDYGAAPLG